MTGIVPIRPSLAPCSPLSRPLRAASGGGLRPVLTAAVRGVTLDLGRDEETAPPVEQRNYARCQTYLQNSPDATAKWRPPLVQVATDVAQEMPFRSLGTSRPSIGWLATCGRL
jgi:hypothetical protein